MSTSWLLEELGTDRRCIVMTVSCTDGNVVVDRSAAGSAAASTVLSFALLVKLASSSLSSCVCLFCTSSSFFSLAFSSFRRCTSSDFSFISCFFRSRDCAAVFLFFSNLFCRRSSLISALDFFEGDFRSAPSDPLLHDVSLGLLQMRVCPCSVAYPDLRMQCELQAFWRLPDTSSSRDTLLATW